MNKILLAGAAVVFAGVAATMALASDHKPSRPAAEPARAAVAAPAKASAGHKGSATRRHHAVKRHHAAHKAHAK